MDRTTIKHRHHAAWTRDHLTESASALMLVPAMMLVLICLGTIAIDMAVLHGAHRSAHRTVSSAADDAASMIDEAELQRSGRLVVDPVRARRVAAAHLVTARLPGRLVSEPAVHIGDGGSTVTVTAELTVDHVMLRAIPGRPDHERMIVTATARLNR